MVENNPAARPQAAGGGGGQDGMMLMWPFVAGKMAMDAAMTASVMLARMAQIAAQSADSALAKYIDLTEQEMRSGRAFAGAAGKESVKVE